MGATGVGSAAAVTLAALAVDGGCVCVGNVSTGAGFCAGVAVSTGVGAGVGVDAVVGATVAVDFGTAFCTSSSGESMSTTGVGGGGGCIVMGVAGSVYSE